MTSSTREIIEANIDGSSDAVVLHGVAQILESEASEAARVGLDGVADLYRTFSARLAAMGEELEPTSL